MVLARCFFKSYDISSRGTNAIKISGEKPRSGQAKLNSNPLKTDNPNFFIKLIKCKYVKLWLMFSFK